MIGGGAISFVAAHWDGIPDGLKIALLLTAMLGCEVVGFVLWKSRRSNEKLGHALVVLGVLVFGASIVLISQIFHLQGEAYTVWFNRDERITRKPEPRRSGECARVSPT